MIQAVIGQGDIRGARVGAPGDIASGIITALVDRAGFIRTGGSRAIETRELVWSAATVKVAVGGTTAVERSLPQLAQVRVDKRIGVAGTCQATTEGLAAHTRSGT
jgi:hypothetical protein